MQKNIDFVAYMPHRVSSWGFHIAGKNDELIDRIEDDLKRYKEVIEETDKNFDSLEILGRYAPCVPYLFKYKIFFYIEYLEKEYIDLSEIKKKYEEVNKKLEVFEKKRGKIYREKVYGELKYFVDTYYAAIDHFLKLDLIDMETENDLSRRDVIEILLNELQKDYDVRKMKLQVSKLDAALKRKFIENMDELLEECPNIEEAYYPENFWWRHPSKFRAANDEFGGKIT